MRTKEHKTERGWIESDVQVQKCGEICGPEPLGLCTSPVQRRCSHLMPTSAQAASQANGSRGVGA
ncbi:hypothetical protein [Hyalangium sp.]|uniref:hypothetical protein n=1 Tax=Hyalangium sp. TaxID=2028555 RepID=UPI00389AA625